MAIIIVCPWVLPSSGDLVTVIPRTLPTIGAPDMYPSVSTSSIPVMTPTSKYLRLDEIKGKPAGDGGDWVSTGFPFSCGGDDLVLARTSSMKKVSFGWLFKLLIGGGGI